MKFFKTYSIPILSGTLFLALLGITMYRLIDQSRLAVDMVMADHIALLGTIFDKIHARCTIVGFEHERNYIDFLTVKSFVSSDIGAMHLLTPDQWRGPYLQENLSVQGKMYEIVKTKESYYIVPGNGVTLSNGKIIGKDIIFAHDTDVESYVNDTVGLEYRGKPLVYRLTTYAPAQALVSTGTELMSE